MSNTKIGSREALYRSLVENLCEYALFAISPTGRIMSWNSGAATMFGYTTAQILNNPFTVLFAPEDAAAVPAQSEFVDSACSTRARTDRWHVRKDGTRFWAKTSLAPIYDGTATLIGVSVCIADMTQTDRGPAQRFGAERFGLLGDDAPECAMFALAPDGSIVSWNAVAQRMFGYAESEILGQPFATLFTSEDIANDVPAIVLHKLTAFDTFGAVDEERWFARKDGSRFLGREEISRVASRSDGSSRATVHVAQDTREQYRINDEWRRRASVDELTQLPNRSTFYGHLRRAIAAIKRRPQNLFAVMFIDLDHFKRINDTLGHLAADRLLGLTARRLEACVRLEDIVARLGGDEFAILLNGIGDIADAIEAADRISAEMRKPLAIGTRDVRATVSVGIALGDPRYERPEDILHDADVAMYAAKADGRGRSMVFTSDLQRGRFSA